MPTRDFRVTYLGHTAVASGGELALLRLFQGLKHVDAHVILGEDGPLVSLLRERGVSVEVLPMDGAVRTLNRAAAVPGRVPLRVLIAGTRHVWYLSRRIREVRPDVVHTNTLKAAIYGGIAGRLAGVPVVWHIRDRIASDYLPRFSVIAIRALARVIPTAIITNSQATRQTLGSLKRAMEVIPSPVIYDALETSSTDPKRPNGPGIVVGMVGRLAPWKGQDVFIEAFSRAFPTGDARAMIVGGALFGEGDYAAGLEALVANLGLTNRIEFAGHVDDVQSMLAQMHIVVHASVIPEPFGQVVVEAMAAGRAVIASAAGGPVEIIRPDVDGLLVPPGDVDALARTLRHLAADPEGRRRLGREARVAAERFKPELIGPQVEQVYEAVTARRGLLDRLRAPRS